MINACFVTKCVAGKVKKGKTQLAIVHNGHKWDKDDGESKTFVPSVINPLDALLLFKKMQDQVECYLYQPLSICTCPCI